MSEQPDPTTVGERISAERRSRAGRFALGLALAGVLGLAIAGIGGVRDSSLMVVAELVYLTLICAAAAAVLLRAVLGSSRRLAWGLVGAGLLAWAVGAIVYVSGIDPAGPHAFPSLSGILYLLFYVGLIVGVRLLGRPGGPLGSLALVVSLLGVATVWSWLVYGGVYPNAVGGLGEVATTLAFPLLDLVLLSVVLAAIAARGWRLDRMRGALAGGAVLLVITDSVYAIQTAQGVYVEGTALAALWPLAAVLIALAAWFDSGDPDRFAGADERPLAVLLAASAIGLAIVVLVRDHFARVDTVTLLLAAATVIAGIAQLLLLHRDRSREHVRALATEAIRRASARAALDCVISIDAGGRVLEWNDAAEATFGYQRSEALGRELASLVIPPDLRERHRQGLARLERAGAEGMLGQRFEATGQHAGGHRFPVELAIARVQDEPSIYTAFARDISDRRRREVENERLAAIVRSASDAVISQDLDGVITAWNDGAEHLYGYPAAEAIGRDMAELIVPGGRREEFEMATTSALAGLETAYETQRRHKDGALLEVAVRAYAIKDVEGEIVGVSSIGHDITEQRRRREREQDEHEARSWRRRIRSAIDDGGLEFWRQPVVDLRTGRPSHHELLLRMRLADRVVAPGEFLPHAERSELIRDVDRWAIRKGVALARRMPVAINLSARSLDDPTLVAAVVEALGTRTPPGNVTFEITETAVAGNLEAARTLAAALAELGCGIALDDFGTGYGSFIYLKHLAITELKVDMQFVRGIATDADDRRVVESIVSIARRFGIRTVAEGVEDEATVALLRQLQVDLAQGYHLGRPAPFGALGTGPKHPLRAGSGVR